MMLPIKEVRIVMPHAVFPNAGDDEHAVRAARLRKPPAGGVDELAQVGASGRSGSRSFRSRTRALDPAFVRCVDAKRKDKAPVYRERRGATGGGLMQVYSETDRGATEKNLFPRTPAQHAG